MELFLKHLRILVRCLSSEHPWLIQISAVIESVSPVKAHCLNHWGAAAVAYMRIRWIIKTITSLNITEIISDFESVYMWVHQ